MDVHHQDSGVVGGDGELVHQTRFNIDVTTSNGQPKVVVKLPLIDPRRPLYAGGVTAISPGPRGFASAPRDRRVNTRTGSAPPNRIEAGARRRPPAGRREPRDPGLTAGLPPAGGPPRAP